MRAKDCMSRTLARRTSKTKTKKDWLHLSLIFVPYVSLIIITFAAISCTSLAPNTGTLLLDIDDGFQINTLLPDVDMTLAHFDFHGDGPSGQSFDVSDDQLPVPMHGLIIGNWTVTVNARNTSNIIVAQGSATTTIQTGNAKTIHVPIRPIGGHGTIDMTVLWNDGDVDVPSIEAQLIHPSGSFIDLDFTISQTEPGRAIYYNENTPTGYYTIVIKLCDSDYLVAGAVEVVRVVANQITSGLFEFYDINQPDGDIVIQIEPDMDEPIEVTLSGQEDEILEGNAMTVTASVPPEVGTVNYVWFVNGELIERGASSITVGSDLTVGYYRLDVTATTLDGSRAGSTLHNFTVIESKQVTLTWDPNPEPDLDGYKIYYGETSGNYTNVIDVGNTETCTVNGLVPGETYYFSATAYRAGLESDFSNELPYTVPL
jgi:hypothetical protein